ncbi:ABC transporter ATP-binding protein [Neorhodopirellula pilleata]|uniref:ABC transporter ATP-binding protein n=2 Tax=Neorhodopirellula pilleata TaxID=2714738 RepID=A0A5C6AUE0_9BACT|nr:ABC transporter ATP-binding protein [Neorhodopirellula pilleata]
MPMPDTPSSESRTINSPGSPYGSVDPYKPNASADTAVRSMATRIDSLVKEYVLKSETVRALQGVSFDVPEGDYVAIMGPSGSGKSTLLNMLGCLDQPTSGNLFLGDDNISLMTDDQLAEIRSRRIGFVFQSYNLIQQLTVVENIQVPLYYQGKLGPKQRARAVELAEQVGLGDRLDHRPNQLSGGQQQRVAIARSLVNDPYFILADEPTGNLDSVTTDEILALFDQLNEEGRTIILVTHEDDVAERARRIVRLKDGLLYSDEPVEESRRDAARLAQRESALAVKAKQGVS